MPARSLGKWSDRGSRGERDCVDAILDGEIDLIINTPWGVGPRVDGYEIRTAAVARGVACVTTIQAAAAAVQGIEALQRGDIGVRSLQDWHDRLRASSLMRPVQVTR